METMLSEKTQTTAAWRYASRYTRRLELRTHLNEEHPVMVLENALVAAAEKDLKAVVSLNPGSKSTIQNEINRMVQEKILTMDLDKEVADSYINSAEADILALITEIH